MYLRINKIPKITFMSSAGKHVIKPIGQLDFRSVTFISFRRLTWNVILIDESILGPLEGSFDFRDR